MTTVAKTLKFDAAHILTDYAGQCKNLHGHTYRVDVAVSSSPSGTTDMVADFRVIRDVALEAVVNRFDHAFLYDERSEAECDIARAVERHGMRAVALPGRTTVENLAKWIYEALESRLTGLSSVCVWETADNRAEYRKEGS